MVKESEKVTERKCITKHVKRASANWQADGQLLLVVNILTINVVYTLMMSVGVGEIFTAEGKGSRKTDLFHLDPNHPLFEMRLIKLKTVEQFLASNIDQR